MLKLNRWIKSKSDKQQEFYVPNSQIISCNMLIYYNEKYNFMWGKRVDTTVMKSLKSIALVGVGQMTS